MNGTLAVGAIADWTVPNQAMGLGVAGHLASVEVVTSQHIETTEENFGDDGARTPAHLCWLICVAECLHLLRGAGHCRAITGPRFRRRAHWPPALHWPG